MAGFDYRASPDWGAKLGYSPEGLREMQHKCINFLRDVAKPYADQLPRVTLAGCIGPRGDAYSLNRRRGKGARSTTHTPTEPDDRTPMEQRAAMTWARRLKRVFSIDISECEKCKGPVKIIACIEDPIVIEKILSHLKAKEAKESPTTTRLPPPRAPPLWPMWKQGLAD
jgi:hypothetical protein